MFRWTPEATPEQKQRVAAELGRLPALLPVLRAYHLGADLGLVECNFEFAAVADFDDLEGYLTGREDGPPSRSPSNVKKLRDALVSPVPSVSSSWSIRACWSFWCTPLPPALHQARIRHPNRAPGERR